MSSATGSAVLPPDRAGSPGSLIVSFAGSYLRELGGWIAVADLIRCLRGVGLAEPAIRQALLRLKSRGFLAAERRAGAAGYRLTEAGLRDLTTGDRRIFRQATTVLDDGWVLAVFSVPESDRHLRHRIRTELSWLGFGTVSPGVWIAPRPLADPTRELLVEAGLDGYVTWFAAHQLSVISVADWWDLSALRAQYDGFLGEHRSAVGGGELRADEAFAGYLTLIDSWRLFPRIDPGLPAALLPADWPAQHAWEVFWTLHQRWAGPGLEHVLDICRGVTRRTAPAQR
ncbi:MAG: PaaX family transcriptional regulator C-terminal domain-containing protein [Nakamurella sp.]